PTTRGERSLAYRLNRIGTTQHWLRGQRTVRNWCRRRPTTPHMDREDPLEFASSNRRDRLELGLRRRCLRIDAAACPARQWFDDVHRSGSSTAQNYTIETVSLLSRVSIRTRWSADMQIGDALRIGGSAPD